MPKDHIIAQVVNDLRDTAIKFHDAQQLRERLRSCIEPLLSAAAPQVVADERELPPLPVCHELMPFKGYPVTGGFCCYTAQQMADYARASIESAKAVEVFQPQDFGYASDTAAAPVQAQEPVAYVVHGIGAGKHYVRCIKQVSEAEDGEWKSDDLRNAISNAIACQGDILQDHNGTVEAIYAAIAAKAANK